MINIKSVTIKNAGRFVGEHKIDLSNFYGLVQVNGKNNNSGGSSGSGKSTIFESIMYALGVGNLPSTILQSRLTKDSLEVEVVFEKNAEEYVVKRSKSDGLVLKTPVQTYTGSNKVAEEELQKILSMPIDLVGRVLHKKQKERGFFMSLTPKQTHSFLSNCLGLEEWTKKQTKIQEDLKSTIAKKESIQSSISNNSALLVYAKQQLESIVIPEGDPDQLAAEAQKLADLSKAAEENIKLLESQRQGELSQISMPSSETAKLPDEYHNIEKEIQNKRSKLSSIKTENQKKRIESLTKIKNLEHLINKAAADSTLLESVEKELKTLKAEILKLRENICPTCTQPWENGHQNSRLNSVIESYKKLMSKEESLKNSIASAVNAESDLLTEKNTLSALDDETEINSIQQDIDDQEKNKVIIHNEFSSHLENIQKNNNDIMMKYVEQTSTVNKKYDNAITPIKFDLDNKKSLSIKMQGDAKSLKSLIEASKSQKEKNVSEISRLSNISMSLENDFNNVSNKIDLIETASKCIESYINFSFQNSLSQIASRVNNILSKVSNTATTTISFDSYKETKSGSIKEEVTILVHMDDELKVPLKSLSGGEETAIELAVDLAVIEMIEQRAGMGFDLYILDEPFDGLDSICKANCLEILANSGTSKKIIIVDHSEETKEMVASKITAVRNGQLSHIEVAQ